MKKKNKKEVPAVALRAIAAGKFADARSLTKSYEELVGITDAVAALVAAVPRETS